ARIDHRVPLFAVRTMEQVVAQSMSTQRISMFLLGAFAVIAMLLSCVGIYGVVSHTITQRTQEIGIRLALGAQIGAVFKLVLNQAMILVITGIGLGVVIALWTTRLMLHLLSGVSANYLVTFTTVSSLLFFIALIACYLPARRATRVDPLVALRYE